MEDLVSIRRHLHQHPELSKEEKQTQKYVLNLLADLDIDEVHEVASTGIFLKFYGETKGKNILFRGDMDALPIQEVNDFEHCSTVDGVSHKCGHDGHTTIMYGLAKYFAENRPKQGNVYIVFQPAEEIGWGAAKVEESGILNDLEIDMVVSLHNVPGYALNKVVCREGSFTPAVTTLIASFVGYTAHAAEPWNGCNPAAAMSEYLLAALQHNEEKKETHEFVTITPVYTEMGEIAYGTSAGEGSVHLTIRADSSEKLAAVLNAIQKKGEELAKKHELEVNYREQERFESNQNAKEVVKLVKQASADLGLEYHDKEEPFRWGEDFGLYTQNIKGAMFGLGSGEDCKPLHHPAYDFPDEIMPTAIEMFITIQKKAQEN